MKNFDGLREKGVQIGKIFRDAERFEKAQKRFEKRERRFNREAYSWTERNRGARNLAVVGSWAFNILSILGLAYLIKYVTAWGLPDFVAYFVGVAFLILFEVSKRKLSDKFWDEYHAKSAAAYPIAFFNFIVIFGLSLGGTFYGYDLLMKEISPEYVAKVTNETIERLENEKALLSQENESLMSNRNRKGEIYWNSQTAIKTNKEREIIINDELTTARAELKTLEEENGATFTGNVTIGITAVLLFMVLMEFLFEICMWFQSYYDQKEYVELKAAQQLQSGKGNFNKALFRAPQLGNIYYGMTAQKEDTQEDTKRKIGFNTGNWFGDTNRDTNDKTQDTQGTVSHVPRKTQDTQGDTHTQDTQGDTHKGDPDFFGASVILENENFHDAAEILRKLSDLENKIETSKKRVDIDERSLELKKKRIRNYWKRSIIEKHPSTRASNLDRFQEESADLVDLGYTIEVNPDDQTKLKIIPPKR